MPLSTKLAAVEAVLTHVRPGADSMCLADFRDTRALHLLLHALRTLWREAGALLQEGGEPPAGWQQSVSSCLSLSGSIARLVTTLGLRELRAGDPAPFCDAVRDPLVSVPMPSRHADCAHAELAVGLTRCSRPTCAANRFHIATRWLPV